MDLALHAADDADGFAKVDLGMSRRMPQQHKHLLSPLTPAGDVILHNREAAREAVLVPDQDPANARDRALPPIGGALLGAAETGDNLVMLSRLKCDSPAAQIEQRSANAAGADVYGEDQILWLRVCHQPSP
jgi:hypothetical protein